ncbi:MAG: LPS assembly lipoprotein LptE [Rhodopila sp.]|nr:LPS assembly lipoprotein LptE [Rhodopila sp.]
MKPNVSRRWLCLGSLATLGGCGFQPVYMPTASGKAGVAQRELASVYVGIIPERPGQLLRQALQERFGNDSGTPSAYDLQVSFGIAGEGIAIETSNLATRIRLTGNASWILLAHDPKRTALTTGNARAIDGVNIFDSQYFAADLEVEAEQKRIAENIATQIATQLAVWFREQAAKKTG